MTKNRLDSIVQAIKTQREAATDEVALSSVDMYPAWEICVSYAVGDRIRHNEILYRCVQVHTSQEGWTPNATPALWTRVSVEEWPEWVQPTGVQDAYAAGDKVSHNGLHWISAVDNNVWEPGVYGWTEAQEA